MRFFYALTLFVILSLTGHAQNKTSIIRGNAKDETGTRLASVSITVQGTDWGTVTDQNGDYLLKLPAGKYKLIASGIGFKPSTVTIDLADKPGIVSFQLRTDSYDMQTVTVTGLKVKSATATRTLTQIEDIPESIAVIGQRVIKQQAAFDLTTITKNISGLNFSGNYSGAGSYQFFNARGFDLNDAQSYRWNGMMIWNLGNNYADNIEQVEFLKGPTSILFGDVAPGGVLNFVTKKPLNEFMATLNIKTGSWGLFRPSLDITGPLTKDHHLKFRLNTTFESSNSFRDYVSSKKDFIAPVISWDISDKFSVNFETDIKRSSATDDAGLVSPNGTISGLQGLSPSLYLGNPSRRYLLDEQDYFITANYEIDKNWRLKATGFLGNTDNRPFGIWFDPPDSTGNFARREYGYHQNSKTNTVSLELAGCFNTGPIKHNILAGLEYQSINYRYTNDGSLFLLDTSNIYKPIFGLQPTVPPPAGPYLPFVSIIARTGAYVQDQLMFLNEKIHLLMGIRAGRTRQGNHYFQNELAGTDYAGYTDAIIAKNIFTPRLGLVYKPKAWWSLYGSYSKGYEINSPDIFAKNYLQYASPPATISSQVEFGSKSNILQDKLGLTISIFQIDKHNPYGYVYLDPLDPDYDDYNVYYQGHHRSQGIELDADGKIASCLSLTAGAAYTKTKIMDDPGYPTGNVLPNAPKFTGNMWLYYEPAENYKHLSLGAGLFYKSSFFSSLANNPDLQIPAGYTVDVEAGYKFKQMNIQLNVMNLTNQVSYLNPWQFNMFDVKPLRQFVLSLTYQITKGKK